MIYIRHYRKLDSTHYKSAGYIAMEGVSDKVYYYQAQFNI
jgi:hypothetical protein